MSGKEWKRKEEMTAPITLHVLEKPTLDELHRRYEETADAETRTRYQMLLLSLRGQTSGQISQIVLHQQLQLLVVSLPLCYNVAEDR